MAELDRIRQIFVDTAGWVALFNPDDPTHQAAKSFWQELLAERPKEIVTTEYVLLETYTFLRRHGGLGAAVTFHETLAESALVKIVEITADIRDKAWEMFRKYEDKDFSFVDCTSLVVMQGHGLSHAFSLDEHFQQMGFQVHP